MNFLFNLANAIKKRNLGVELIEIEKTVYEQAYCDCFGKNAGVIDKDSEVFDYYCSLFKIMIRDRDMLKFKIFNGLLHYNNSSVSLVDFCRFCGVDGAKIEDRQKVVDGINSWILDKENKVKYNLSCTNPLLGIKSLEEIEMGENVSENLKIAIITGLNIGGKCIDENGKIDDVKLYDSIISYINFRNKFLSDMKENDIHLDGIVLMGDLFDLYSNVYALANTNVRVINSLVKKLSLFSKNNRDIVNIDDCDFIGVVSGHRDVWFGKRLVDAVKVFGDNAMYLGSFGPCTTIKNNYKHFSDYLYKVYNDVLIGDRSKEGMLCYFISPEVAENLRVKDNCYDVTVCDLEVDGINVVNYSSNTITYDCKKDDYGIVSEEISKIKLKNK